MERTSDYWFMIEPYVHINIANGYMLLYNTLDKETIISNNEKVINLLEELLQDENCGVTILKNEQYRQNNTFFYYKFKRKIHGRYYRYIFI